MNRVGIYLRVSTEEQARIQDGSLVSQRKRLEEHVEEQNKHEANWGAVIDVYCDQGLSAKNMNRPEFQRMLTDVRCGRINLILATELSRLSRSIRDFSELWDFFKRHDTKIVTLRERFDSTNAAGEMMIFNLINFAQYERKQTAERISANWLSRAKRGLWNGGNIPLGYDRNPQNKGHLVVNDEEAKQVKRIFKIFLKKESLRQTCDELSRLGIFTKEFLNRSGATKGGKHFTLSGLHGLLTNRAYIGMREINKKATLLGKADTVKAAWPAIIDEPSFCQVQLKLSANKHKYKPNHWKNYPFPLTQTVVCGECGKPLGGKTGHGRNGAHYYYGHCRNPKSDGLTHKHRCQLENVRAPRVEEMVLKFLKELLSSPAKIDDMISAYQRKTVTEIPVLEGRLKSIEQDIRTAETRMENLVNRLADIPQDVSAELIYQRIKDMTEKMKELVAARDGMKAEKQQTELQSIDKQQLKSRIENAVLELEKLPAEKQRPVFAQVLKFVELHPTKIRMGLYAPSKTKNPEDSRNGSSGSTFLLPTGTRVAGSSTVRIGSWGRS